MDVLMISVAMKDGGDFEGEVGYQMLGILGQRVR
ncbi:hypothetical protein QG37_04645 [Candidozyma auris]|nr:hypothetical protein QG37_04645 [[Candida] auris]